MICCKSSSDCSAENLFERKKRIEKYLKSLEKNPLDLSALINIGADLMKTLNYYIYRTFRFTTTKENTNNYIFIDTLCTRK